MPVSCSGLAVVGATARLPAPQEVIRTAEAIRMAIRRLARGGAACGRSIGATLRACQRRAGAR